MCMYQETKLNQSSFVYHFHCSGKNKRQVYVETANYELCNFRDFL